MNEKEEPTASDSYRYDEIGYWSEVKLDIIKEYAAAYSKILTAQNKPKLHHAYIDAFSGGGIHKSKTTGEYILGSPLNALNVDPPFKDYYFIDLDKTKAQSLREKTSEMKNVHIYHEDCNVVLLKDVFPNIRYENFKRALCLLDPYGLHLNWDVIKEAGKSSSIEIFLNFPVSDMHRNVLWNNIEKVDERQLNRMNAFWGDESWRDAAYDTKYNLFGDEEKTTNQDIVNAFKKRLKEEAGFKYIAEDPIPMRNTAGATMYYLFFASQKPVAAEIVSDIFNKYRDKGKK